VSKQIELTQREEEMVRSLDTAMTAVRNFVMTYEHDFSNLVSRVVAMNPPTSNTETGNTSSNTATGNTSSNTTPTPIPPPMGETIRVRSGDNIQAALDRLVAAGLGGTILMQPGEYYVNLKLRQRPARQRPIFFVTDTSNLPAIGHRIHPDYKPGLAIFYAADRFVPAIDVEYAANGYRFLGVGVGPQLHDRDLVSLGGNKAQLWLPEQMAYDIEFDRVLLFGDPVRGQHRAIRANARDIRILGCYMKDFHEQGRDSQAVCGWNGAQDILIENSYLEASGENVLMGGADCASEAMMPMNWTLRGNHIAKNPAWMSGMQYPPTVKCLVESKNLKGLLMENNVMEHCWKQAWPTGVAVVIKSANQEGTNPFAITRDVIMRHNVVRNVGSYVSIQARNDSNLPSGVVQNVDISHNLFAGLDSARGTGAAFVLLNGPEQVVIDHNSVLDNRGTFISFDNTHATLPVNGFRYTNNFANHGDYGIHSSTGSGKTALTNYYGTTYDMRRNAIRKHPDRTNSFPAENTVIDSDFRPMLDADLRIKDGTPLAAIEATDGGRIGANVNVVLQRTNGVA
jgi:hypothetical protein